MNLKNARPVRILLVEDSPSDVKLTMEALKLAKIMNEVSHVADGVEAMNFLRKQGRYSRESLPDLILLDLNLPRKDGREVLEEVKSDPVLKVIPVVVLTTSKAEEDVLRCYQLHANCYLIKPVNFDQFEKIIQTIENFWLTVVVLPSNA